MRSPWRSSTRSTTGRCAFDSSPGRWASSGVSAWSQRAASHGTNPTSLATGRDPWTFQKSSKLLTGNAWNSLGQHGADWASRTAKFPGVSSKTRNGSGAVGSIWELDVMGSNPVTPTKKPRQKRGFCFSAEPPKAPSSKPVPNFTERRPGPGAEGRPPHGAFPRCPPGCSARSSGRSNGPSWPAARWSGRSARRPGGPGC